MFTGTFRVICPSLAVELIARFTRSGFQILKGDKASRQARKDVVDSVEERNMNVQESWLPHLNFVANNLPPPCSHTSFAL